VRLIKAWLKERNAMGPVGEDFFVRERRAALSRKTLWAAVRCDGELAGLPLPAAPEASPPPIRFGFVAPPLWIGLPPDPASRRRPGSSAHLRLGVHRASGRAPDALRARPGTHAPVQRRRNAVRCNRWLGRTAMNLLGFLWLDEPTVLLVDKLL
jgi:hypothetical protein